MAYGMVGVLVFGFTKESSLSMLERRKCRILQRNWNYIYGSFTYYNKVFDNKWNQKR